MTDGLAGTLDAIRAALREGNYAALSELAAELDAQTEGAATMPAAELRLLRQRATETAACLVAARNGIRAARRRVAEVTGGPAALSTYDREGRRSPPGPGASVPKRL